MMQESSLAQFALQSAASLPAITLGLPATTSARVGSQVVGSPRTGQRVPHGAGEALSFGPGVPGVMPACALALSIHRRCLQAR